MLVRYSIFNDLLIHRTLIRQRALKALFISIVLASPFGLQANEDDGAAQLPGYYYELNDIVVNLTEGNKRVYLMLNIGISVLSQKDMARLQEDEKELRVSILQLMRKMGYEELSKSDGRLNCHNKLRVLLKSHLPAGHLKRLFLLNYILR